MNRRVVDASPLIFLAKLGHLDLLRLGVEEVLIPAAALAEVRAKRDPTAATVEAFLGDWLKECTTTQSILLRLLPSLGQGEQEAIAQALQEGIASIVLDDQRARRTARCRDDADRVREDALLQRAGPGRSASRSG